MVDGSFREHFHSVLYLGQQTWPHTEYELIWVEYFDQVRPDLAALVAQLPNARILTLGRRDEYHSSYCFNAGILAARGEVILIPDADVVVEIDFLERIWALHQENEKLVTYCYRYNEPREQHRSDIDISHLKRCASLTQPSNWGGCIGVRKKWLLEANGYEMHPWFSSGDHGNDFDMYVRLKNMGLHVCWPRQPVLYHPWHPGTLRFAYTHKLQALVTQYRAHNLMYLPFHGIDSSLDSEVPLGLLEHVHEARVRLEQEMGSYESPPADRF
jgi:glycosyl transferase family 2